MICDKQAFDTYREVSAATQGRAKQDGRSYKSYKCKLCGKFHFHTASKSPLRKEPKNLRKEKFKFQQVEIKKVKPIKIPTPKPPSNHPERHYATSGKLLTDEQAKVLKQIINSHPNTL